MGVGGIVGIAKCCTFLLQLDLIEWHKKQSYVFILQIGFMTGNVYSAKCRTAFLYHSIKPHCTKSLPLSCCLLNHPNPTFTLSYFR